MERDELIRYWTDSADEDARTMSHLFASGDYSWSLFMGHIGLEKALKAACLERTGANPPPIHDLLRLAEKASFPLNDEQRDFLDTVTTFNIRALYDDVKREFARKSTKQYAREMIRRIKEFHTWIRKTR